MTQTKFQIGKNGLTEQTATAIDNALKNHDQVRVSILPTATRDRKALERIAEQLQRGLKTPTRLITIGFTLILKKSKSKL